MHVPQSELVPHIVVLIRRIRACSLYFCPAEPRVSMVVEGGFTVGIGASFDIDGRVARAGDVVAVEVAFELAFAESRDWGGGGVVD